ncbi:MAG: ATP-binding protein [Flexilinea sp.]|jgi:anti-sigma regulatory factor (Ser/Thr protein kinase)
MKEITVTAETTRLEDVLNFIDRELENVQCSIKVRSQIAVAVEEIFVNIAQYAYRPEIGEATIQSTVNHDPLIVTIQFFDRGMPYNPLERSDPNTKLGINERNPGGLGIFIVKKTMDEIDYEYKDGKNILTIRKTIVQ